MSGWEIVNKMKKLTFYFVIILFFFSCVTTRKSPIVNELLSPDMDLFQDDKTLVFPMDYKGKGAFFSLDIESGNVAKISPVCNGSYGQIRLLKSLNDIIYIQTIKETDGYKFCMMSNTLNFDKPDTLLTTPFFISDFALSTDDSIAYLSVVGDFGSSSPIVKVHPRSYILYSLNIKTKKTKRIIDTAYYMMPRSITVSNTNELVYSVFQGEKKLNGCLSYNLNTNKIKSINPSNIKELKDKKATVFFNEYFIHYYKSFNQTEAFLISGSGIYKMDLKTMIAKPFYIQSEEDRKENSLQGLVSFHKSDKIIILKEIKPFKSSFCLLNNSGEVLKTFVPNYDSLFELIK